ncbi:MAG: hypothetical protein KAH57_01895 [Thermoplasmata archaeon]|nr:hypothetical protein [Thermoplasmata archaeon]
MKGGRDHGLDALLFDIVSYGLFQKGKEPLSNIDPRRRVKRGIWTDDGVDLNLLRREGVDLDDSIVECRLFQTESMMVKEGLFRRRKEHIILSGLSELGWVEDVDPDELQEKGDAGGLAWVLSSDLLYPLGISASFHSFDRVLEGLEIERAVQHDPPRTSQIQVRNMLLGSGEGDNGEEDLSSLFSRKVKKADWIKGKSGGSIKDLGTLITAVYHMEEEDLQRSLEGGDLADFAGKALHSNLLEGEILNLSSDPDGGIERPDEFRKRFGRWLLEGEMAQILLSDIIKPRLGQLRSCSAAEGRRLGLLLKYLMDARSSPDLKGLLFDVPPRNRVTVIQLMASTGDVSVMDLLERLQELSSVEEDRDAAGDALRELDVGAGSNGR